MTKVQVHAWAKFILSILYTRVNGYGWRWNVLIPIYPLDEVFCLITVGVSTPGVPGPTSKLSLRVPAQMGRREIEHMGKKGEPRLVLSCAQGGCACIRGLQEFAREGESLFVSPFSCAATFSYEGPRPSFYKCKERAQVYNGGCSNMLTCLAERSQSPMYMPTWLSERC
jgi:hypothetical protein